jgi:hypothetical protein
MIFFQNMPNLHIRYKLVERKILKKNTKYKLGTGYEYDGNVFVAWVLQVRREEVVTTNLYRICKLGIF